MRIALYAPLKPPDHPVPSGDRRMGRLLIQALEAVGHEVALASELRSFEPTGETARQEAIRDRARAETDRLLAGFRAEPPEAWFTYHVYYKAPDWIGPRVSAALGIPYVIAEPSHAPKRAHGPWRDGHDATVDAIVRADALFCMTRHDMAGVAPLVERTAKLEFLPPFLDAAPFAGAARRKAASRAALASSFALDPGVPWLLSVAMMRPGDKLASYRQLATVLAFLQNETWQLVIAGDGPAEPARHAGGPSLDPLQQRLLELLDDGPVSLDVLVLRAAAPVPEVLVAAEGLERHGLLARDGARVMRAST